MTRRLIILESPEKASRIREFAKKLGMKDIDAAASVGHITKLGDTGKNQIGVVDWNTMKVDWEIDPLKTKVINELVKKANEADEIILTSDPDREGEAIAWHVQQVLEQKGVKKPFKRMRLNAITPQELKKQLETGITEIDMATVNAANARAIADKLIGYSLSPIVQKQVGGKSTGRVQGANLTIIATREDEVNNFAKSYTYEPTATVDDKVFDYVEDNGKGTLVVQKLEDKDSAEDIIDDLGLETKVSDISEKEFSENPFTPFDTLSLYQAAKQKLGLNPKKTPDYLQNLYTKGLITYIRTDSKRLDPDFEQDLYKFVGKTYGDEFIGEVNKPKEDANAQDGHPAITPTDMENTPDKVESMKDKLKLSDTDLKVYELIFNNTLNAALRRASGTNTSVVITNNNHSFKATFKQYKDFGLYELGIDTNKPENDAISFKLGDKVNPQFDVKEIEAKPKPRFDEASLIGEDKRQGIGRPSTYSAAASANTDRGYVEIDKKGKMHLTDLGRKVNDFMQDNFQEFVSVGYTKDMEDDLDKIAKGELDWKKYLKGISDEIFARSDKQASDYEDNLEDCPKCKTGKLIIRTTKTGKQFKGCSNYPKCDYSEWINNESLAECPSCHQKSVFTATAKNGTKFEKCKECDYIKFFNKKK